MSAQKKPSAKPAATKSFPATRKASASKSEKAPSKKAPQPRKTSGNCPAVRKALESSRDFMDAPETATYKVMAGKFVSISPLFESVTGYKREEMIGSRLLDHVHADDREIVRETHARNMKSGSREPFEYRFIRKDGEIIWLLETCGPTADDRGRALFASVMDVSRLRRAEDSVDLKNERYRTILQEIDESYYENDLKGNLTFVNDALARNLGYSKEELIGMNYRQYSDAETAKKMQILYTEAYRTGKPFTGFEGAYIRKDGSLRYADVSATLVRDKKGNPIGFRGLSRDITKRKLEEDVRRQNDERYKKILENMTDAYFENDLTGRLTFVNEMACQHLGYSREELIGTKSSVFQDEAGAQKTLAAYHQLFQTGEPVRALESEFIRKDGSRGIYELTVDLILDAKGAPVGFRGVSRDITERKRMENELRKSEARYRTILEEIKEGYGELDLKGTWTFVNEAGAQNIGYKPEEIIGKNYRDFTDEASAKKMFELFNDLYKTGRSFKGQEVEFISRQGNRRVVEISGALVRDEAGHPVGFRGLSRYVTERKWQEDALLQSEAKYFSIIESIGDAYFETDLRGMTTFVNDRASEDLGYTREELLRMSNRDLQDEVSAQETYAIFNEVYETGRPVKAFQYKAIRKDGSRAVFEMSISLMRDAQGKPIGFRGLSRDITERKRIEDALVASEEKYRSIIDSIVDGYVEVDLAGNWTFVNDVICNHMLYSREELLTMNFQKLHTEQSAARAIAAFAEVYKTGKPIKALEIEAVRKDGSAGVYELSVSLAKDSGGQAVGFRCISRDITERKRMENALRASEERSRTIIETIPDPYYEIDLKGKMTYINSAYITLTGYTLADLQTISYSNFLDQENAAIVIDVYKTVYKTGLTMKNVELAASMKNGEKRLVNLSVGLIRDEKGQPAGFHGMVRDITERKKAEDLIRKSEQSLRQYSEQLEERVKERTAELERSKVAAEAASRAKSDFMANISHEFQTPLNAVIGFTKVLQDRMFGDLNEKQDEFVRYIAEAGISLSRIITEILDASRVSSGSIRPNYSLFSLVEVLAKTNRMLELPMKEKMQTITIDVALDADVQIEADEQKIQQVFFHLISNAVKYTPEGGKIDVRAYRTVEEGSRLEGVSVAIRDNGVGIKAEDIPRLFQNFGTLASPYTRSDRGIGMGLALAKQLLELHGGSIRVESEVGKGSCFTVFLPLKQ